MDRLTEIQLEDLTAMRQAYRDQAYRVILAEKIGTAGLDQTYRLLYPKKSLLKRLLRRG